MGFVKRIIPNNILNVINNNWTKYSKKNSFIKLDNIINKNINKKCYIGRGYYPVNTPEFLVRHVLENPKWYTAYTPYQSEISQGRLESLFNFQSMICDLTRMDSSNASLLDESTAISEAMYMLYNYNKYNKKIFMIDRNLHVQNMSVLIERANHLNIELCILQDNKNINLDDICGIIIQNPDTLGNLLTENDEKFKLINKYRGDDVGVIEVSDLLSCVLFKPPGENNFDISVGSTQRLGLPMWFGGPHAGFISCKSKYNRYLPGRIVGQSIDSQNNVSYRLTLQTREQHIKKDRATSNICTAQALLANFASFYGMYHGSKGLTRIAENTYNMTSLLHNNLSSKYVTNNRYFDTVSINRIFDISKFEYSTLNNNSIFSLNEMVEEDDIIEICEELDVEFNNNISKLEKTRESKVLDIDIFNKYNDENSLTRYIYELCDRDYSLVNGMIPLGSCTMKLNPVFTLTELTNKKLNLHPYTDKENAKGYMEMLNDLKLKLRIITGMDDVSLQPNAGSQGEYAGLLAIKKYLNDSSRNTVIIPDSAHGTNFASAKLAGFDIAKVKTKDGLLNIDDIKNKLEKNNIAALMVTYPSTFGIYDDNIKEIVDLVHEYGAQVYMDGANMNAQLGWTSPGFIGADVCHLNLHKTFAIPHGGGGPGMGPICVKKHLSEYLPDIDNPNISGSPYGSASILSISWLYLLNNDINDLRNISEKAIQNANYLMNKLKDEYKILYTKNGCVAHEFIIDCSEFKKYNISELDIAKRLLDYEFHSPTLSWPIANTIMIEPTESENIEELDRFINAMICIKKEIITNPDILKNAPHSLDLIKSWDYKYSIKDAYYPNNIKRSYFPSRNRINEVYGDRNIKVKY